MNDRYFATKNDDNVAVVYDWEDSSSPVDSFPGESLWVARRLADHLNGKHAAKRNAKCDLCREAR